MSSIFEREGKAHRAWQSVVEGLGIQANNDNSDNKYILLFVCLDTEPLKVDCSAIALPKPNPNNFALNEARKKRL